MHANKSTGRHRIKVNSNVWFRRKYCVTFVKSITVNSYLFFTKILERNLSAAAQKVYQGFLISCWHHNWLQIMFYQMGNQKKRFALSLFATHFLWNEMRMRMRMRISLIVTVQCRECSASRSVEVQKFLANQLNIKSKKIYVQAYIYKCRKNK